MERMRELREEKGLSQAQAAVRAGMDPSTWNRLEQGKGNPNLKTLERVADALGVEVADLFPKAFRPSPEPSLLNGLEEERRASSVLSDALVTAAEELTSTEPPRSLADVLKRFGILDVLYSVAEPLHEFAKNPARWERLSLDERMAISRAAATLYDSAMRLGEQNNEYLERRREDRETSREAAAAREWMREVNRRHSA